MNNQKKINKIIKKKPQNSRIICAWCKKILAEGVHDGPISHGICDECNVLLEYEQISIDELFDQIKIPVFLVDELGFIKNANQISLNYLKKDLKEIENQLGGNVLRCIYANLPGGCGKSIHCSGCTIRNTVTETHNTGKTIRNREGYQYIQIHDGVKKFYFLISTKKIDAGVLLFIEKMDESDEKIENCF